MSDYSSSATKGSSVAAISTAASPPVVAQPNVLSDAKAGSKASEAVTPQAAPPVPDGHIEQKLEYRDQDGKILNESQVKELEGKVSFSTRYETRTRYLDAQGNEVDQVVKVEEENKAPHQPEVEKVPGTKGSPEAQASEAPAIVSPKGAEKADEGKKEPRPASEAQGATASDAAK